MDHTNTGFVGLGLMGSAFTARMIESGLSVYGYDCVEEKLSSAGRCGVNITASAAEVASHCQQIHVCVMTTDDLQDVVFGDQGLASVDGRGKVMVDHSTTPAEVTRDWAERLKTQSGMAWVDAPVSGGPPAAREGKLAIMAGGDSSVVERALPVLQLLGECTHMGDTGAGQVTKMVNQVLVLNNYCVLAEALALAEAGGVDASKIPTALANGYAGSNMLERLYPRMVERDFAPAGYAFQISKDLKMVQALAGTLNVPTPMSSKSSELFKQLNDNGDGELDGIAVLKLFEQGGL